MPLKPAARMLDIHPCPAHGPGPITEPCEPTVVAELQPMARITDHAACANGAVDSIVSGSLTVKIGNRLAARETDQLAHGGSLVRPLATRVFIGGPTVRAGSTIGDIAAGRKACREAAAGRASGRTQQTYGNCSVEDVRQIINQDRATRGEAPIDEDTLLEDAVDHGEATDDPDPFAYGGANAEDNQSTLGRYGVESDTVAQTGTPDDLNRMGGAVADGRGVITGHDAGRLWGTENEGGHAVNVIGMTFDENGDPSEVIVNDTGIEEGNCAHRYPAGPFARSLIPNGRMVVTREPVW